MTKDSGSQLRDIRHVEIKKKRKLSPTKRQRRSVVGTVRRDETKRFWAVSVLGKTVELFIETCCRLIIRVEISGQATLDGHSDAQDCPRH